MNAIAPSLQESIKAAPDCSILVIAYEFPDFLANHRGIIVYFGGESPKSGLACQQMFYRCAPQTGDILHAFQILRNLSPSLRFDLVFVDHNHSLEQLVAQIGEAVGFAHADTVWLFDDAIPPEFPMTGPVATQDWWVGEVWMLSELMQRAQRVRECWAIPLAPTGLLVAVGIRKFSADEFDEDYQQLSHINSLEQLLSHVPLVPERMGLHKLRSALSARVHSDERAIAFSLGSEDAVRSEQLESAHDWTQPELDFVLDLSEGTSDVSALFETRTRMSGKRVDTFSDVLLTGFDSFVKQDTFYSKHVEVAESDARRLVDEAKYTRTTLQFKNDQLILPKRVEAGAMRIDSHILLATPDEPDNWGMWILHGIPSAHWFIRERSSYDFFFTCLHQPWQRRLLQHVGLTPRDLMEHQLPLTYACAQMSTIRYDFRNLAVNKADRAIFQEISDRYAEKARGPYGERIYVARNLAGNAHNGRRLVNEYELAEKLQERDFSIVQPEKLEFPDQVRAFAGARVIVGSGGAAMFNSVFARPGTKVVSIESSTMWAPSHSKMFTSMGLNCGMIIGCQDLTDPEPVHKSWGLDVDAALRQIDAYLA
jgi:capsular polysaccharide biosynthesis protein